MAAITRGKPRSKGSAAASSARALGAKAKASLGPIEELVALYEREHTEKRALLAENAKLKKIVERVMSAVGGNGTKTSVQASAASPTRYEAPPKRRKRKAMSPEARAQAAQNLAKARAVRAANLARRGTRSK